MLKTEKIQLTPKTYYQLWKKRSLVKSLFLAIILFLLGHGVLFVIEGEQGYLRAFFMNLSLAILYPLLVLSIRYASIKRFYNTRQNSFFYEPFYLEIDQKFIKQIKEDGSMNIFNWNNFIKAQKIGGFYGLYIAKVNVLYIPVQSFSNQQDREKFEQILKKKAL